MGKPTSCRWQDLGATSHEPEPMDKSPPSSDRAVKRSPLIRGVTHLSQSDTENLINSAQASTEERSKVAVLCSLPFDKLMLIILTFISVLFYSGTIFGWAPMLLVLQKEGVYKNLCH